MKLSLAPALVLTLALASPVCGERPVNCRWGPYGSWSDCDGCTKTKVRTRHVEVFAQFDGTPCSGEATERQSCVPQRACPLETGCGGRFRCTSGQCISQLLMCNGDQDCEDGLDERNCGRDDSHYSCDLHKTPPNSDFTGRGYDVLTDTFKAGVINTLSFGGQCRKVFSGDHKVTYRLPQNILRYNFEVQVDNEESDESYLSTWSYMQDVQSNALIGHDRRSFHKELSDTKAYRIIILKNKVALAQFQNSAPDYLPLSESFWKDLSSLPLTYDYSAYRRLLQTYGTHYLAEGVLGGEYQGLLELDQHAFTSTSTTDIEYQRCWRKVKRFLFFKKVKTVCEKLKKTLSSSSQSSGEKLRIKVKTFGGDPSFLNVLSELNLETPEVNGETYNNWASSVKDFPDVIDQKLRPLHELVKEVHCAALKKLHLKTATEEYLAEQHPCHCRPCQNNGRPLLTGTVCRCVCRPGTSGSACQTGSVIGEQPGVIHGSWSCWSSWSSCSEGQRSRTRSCNNPAPRNGGHSCIGPAAEQKSCEEPGILHLQMMAPQCFGLSIAPPKTCGPPPGLRNGFVTNPKDFYLVGQRVQYSCIEGFYLSGDAVATCADDQTWRTEAKLCKSSTCGTPPVKGLVLATPSKAVYQIGESVSLSCPEGSVLSSEESTIMCTPSLQWSPSPGDIHCEAVPLLLAPPAAPKCKVWENVGERGCVCKMTFQCLTSLTLCAKVGSRHMLLGLCRLGALRCLGRNFTVVRDQDCDWPEETFTSCENCQPGTVCEEGRCLCQEASTCPADSAPVCVSSGKDGVRVTMTECEVGAKRCAGERLHVLDIDACPA
uniref:Complement component C7 n=1 Tax=Oryzias sinensis TaxID=183150 RepID=A0A8C7YVE9_9TELE